MSTPDYTSFTITRVAEQLDLSPDIVRAHIRDGRLRAFDAGAGAGKRCWRIRAADLDAFIRARQNTEAPQTQTPRRRRREEQTVTRYY